MVKWLRRDLGRLAERKAGAYLKRQGLDLVEYNFLSRFGEIDIVLKEGEQWVFVEVRSRAKQSFMRPEESINQAKQRRLWLTGQAYLQRLPLGEQASARFDVVTILLGHINWIKNAFILN
jgi:putative endonuclease